MLHPRLDENVYSLYAKGCRLQEHQNTSQAAGRKDLELNEETLEDQVRDARSALDGSIGLSPIVREVSKEPDTYKPA